MLKKLKMKIFNKFSNNAESFIFSVSTFVFLLIGLITIYGYIFIAKPEWSPHYTVWLLLFPSIGMWVGYLIITKWYWKG